jgi:hypothetical protein
MTGVVNMGDNFQMAYQARKKIKLKLSLCLVKHHVMTTHGRMQYALHSFAPGIDLSVHRGSVSRKTMKRSP